MIPAGLERLVDDLRLGPEAPLVSGLGALFSSCWTANGAIIAALAELASGASIPLAVFYDTDNHAASSTPSARSARRSPTSGCSTPMTAT